MRVVADTNVIVSGLLWHGAPRRMLDAARIGTVDLFKTTVLLVELEDVLSREKFADRLAAANVSPRELVLGYAALATVIEPAEIAPVIAADPDDDAVLACAIAARARIVVSGDNHLLELKRHQHIHILKAAELLTHVRGE